MQVDEGKLVSGDRPLDHLPAAVGRKPHLANPPLGLEPPHRRHTALGIADPGQVLWGIEAMDGETVDMVEAQPFEGALQVLRHGGRIGLGRNLGGNHQIPRHRLGTQKLPQPGFAGTVALGRFDVVDAQGQPRVEGVAKVILRAEGAHGAQGEH